MRPAARPLLLAASVFLAGPAYGQNDLSYVDSLLWSKAYDVEIAGEVACCSFLNGLLVLDVSDKTAPAPLSRLYVGGGFGIDVQGKLAAVAAGENGLQGSFITPGSIISAAAAGKRHCAIGDLSGLQVLDLRNPARPSIDGSADVFRGVHGLTAGGNLAVSTERWGIRILDLSDPANITLVKRMRISGVARTPLMRGEHVFLTADLAGFHIVSIKNPAEPEIIATFEMTGFAYGLDVEGDYAYVANSDTGFHILNITDLTAPAQVGHLKTPGPCYGVDVRGRYAYIADGPNGLQILDVSDPAKPAVIGSCAIDGFANGVKVSGTYAYLSAESFGLRKIDISDPKAPTLVASFRSPGEPAGVAIHGDHVILLDSFSLIILKSSPAPKKPVEVTPKRNRRSCDEKKHLGRGPSGRDRHDALAVRLQRRPARQAEPDEPEAAPG